MKLTLSAEQLQAALGNLKGNVALNLGLDLSGVKPGEIIQIATSDAKLVADLLDSHQKEFSDFLSSFTSGDFQKANAILEEIGGTEDDFLKVGGGAAGLVILLVAVVLLYACPAK
jgi:hypothetical protein